MKLFPDWLKSRAVKAEEKKQAAEREQREELRQQLVLLRVRLEREITKGTKA